MLFPTSRGRRGPERISLYMNGRLYSGSFDSSLERYRTGWRKVDGDSGEGATMADTRQAEVDRL